MPAPKHILVLRFSAMGDVAMTVPVIKAMLAQNPDVFVTFVSRPAFAGFFTGIPRLTFLPVNLKSDYKGFKGIFKLYQFIKLSGNYNALADLHDILRTKLLRTLFRLSGTPVKQVDKGRSEKKLLTRFPGKVLQPLKRTAQRYADVFIKLGLPVELDYQRQQQPEVLTEEIIRVTGKKTTPWIGVSPFAQHKGKVYPFEKMDKVLRILSRYEIKIFLFGGAGLEEELCLQWQQQHEKVFSMIGRINMAQELILISNLNVMLSMDSAGMHLASLKGTPVVSIWGATHYYAGFLGYGQSLADIVADTIECRPCSVYGNKPCFRKDYACLHRIEPETVVNHLLKFI